MTVQTVNLADLSGGGDTVPDAELAAAIARDTELPVAGSTPSTQALGDAAAGGSGTTWSKNDHKHGMPADPAASVIVSAPAQALGTSDAYVTGSDIAIPAALKVGSKLRWRIFVTKTAASTAAPVIRVRFGTAGAIGDTARITLTGLAQDANAESGCFDIEIVVTATGASGNVLGMITLSHQNGSRGLSIGGWGQQGLSANFDLTVANLKAGVSINAGASSAWTVNRMVKEVTNT